MNKEQSVKDILDKIGNGISYEQAKELIRIITYHAK